MHEDLRQRISTGSLPAVRVAVAAGLGAEAAIGTGVAPLSLPEDYGERVELVATHLSDHQCRAFVVECAARAVSVWEATFPADLRPRQAIKAAEAALEGAHGANLGALSEAAARARIEVDYPELTEDVDAARCRAMHAAGACSHAALAFCHNDSYGDEELHYLTGWTAHAVVKAAADPLREMALQTERLAAILLE